MLKILFSPSEGKKCGGDTLLQSELFGATNARDEILKCYNEIILSGDQTAIKNLFGMKKFSDCEPYIGDIFHMPLMSAIERYQGVAYDYLAFESLSAEAQTYLKENTVIFSNLYGVLLGGDKIANYKVKQGNSIGEIAPDKFYKERFSYQLDLYLSNCDILDLRAAYYEKFYTTKQSYTTLKFLKNGKVLSHWAKAYRGIVLKELAQNAITSLDSFMSLQIDGIEIENIETKKNKTEVIYKIIN